MNKRLLKKLSKKNSITKEDAQKAFNVVSRYLNNRPELSFNLRPWTSKDERKYSISVLENDEFEDILIADTIRPNKL